MLVMPVSIRLSMRGCPISGARRSQASPSGRRPLGQVVSASARPIARGEIARICRRRYILRVATDRRDRSLWRSPAVVIVNARARKTDRNAASQGTRSPSRPRPPRDSGRVNDRSSALQSLRALVNALGRSARRIERRTGLTNAQLFVLRQIADATRGGGTLAVGELAARALTRPSTASAVVSRLIGAGLVQRQADARDARRRALTLSARGRSALARAPKAPTERVLRALARLSERDAGVVANGLVLLTRAMHLDASAVGVLCEDRTEGRQQARGRPS